MNSIPEVYGLVLLGGKSVRMGQDKAVIEYHQQPQYQVVANLLSIITVQTYISGRVEQRAEFAIDFPFISDAYGDIGPLGGILSALKKHPDKAWLVMAIDLPNMDIAGIQQLFSERDSTKDATAFWNIEKDGAEPLMTIWEPSIQAHLLEAYAKKQLSVKRILAQAKLKMVQANHPEKLLNVNRPNDFLRK